MELVLIRHLRPAVEAGVCYGWSDVALADAGDPETKRLRERLGAIAAGALFSSPLRRCRNLAESLGVPRLDERLKELHFGRWEMLPWDRIDRDQIDHWNRDIASRAPPEGESFGLLQRRAIAFVQERCAEHHREIVVVTHAGVIRALVAHVLDMALEKSFALRVDFGSLTKIEIESGNARLHWLNA